MRSNDGRRDRRAGGSNDTSAELRAALNTAVQQPGLTLSVQAVPFKSTAKEASVALTVELDGAALELAQQANGLFADTLEVSFFALNDDSRAQRGTRAALNLAVRPDTYQRVRTLGLRFNSRTTMPAGRYQLRVGARNPVSGKTGTVFYDVVVPDFSKDPLMTSGLLVSSLPGPTSPDVLTPQRDPVSEKLLGAPPTSRRTFARDETLAWMAEIYDNSLPKQPKQIDVSARLIDEGGRDAFASRDLLANGEGGAPKWQAFGYTGQIPLKDIAPGRYLLRIEAQDRGAADTTTGSGADGHYGEVTDGMARSGWLQPDDLARNGALRSNPPHRGSARGRPGSRSQAEHAGRLRRRLETAIRELARSHSESQRTTREDLQVHDEVGRQQDLQRHLAG